MSGKDFKKALKPLYAARKNVVVEVEAPPLDYLMLDVKGDPTKRIGDAIGALYAIAYPLKFMVKARAPASDYVVMPPEGLFHATDGKLPKRRDAWRWTVLVLQPVKVTAAELARAKAAAKARGAGPLADKVRLGTLREGRCVETLHVGPYAAEGKTIARMDEYIREHGLKHAGPHHEVYLSDPHRVAPGKLRTILRAPVARA